MITEKDFITAIMKAATYAESSPMALVKKGGVRYHHNEMKAVFELAKKMAVEFANWVRENKYTYFKRFGWIKNIDFKAAPQEVYDQPKPNKAIIDEAGQWPSERKKITTEQLLELYLNQK